MKKIKINIDRAKVSKEEIDSKRNFENILAKVMSYSKPFYKTKIFLNSILVMLFATVVVYTVSQLEKKVRETKAHENDGYAQISTAKEIGSIDSLKTQEFVVQIDRDTILETAEGAVIKIAAGSLVSTNAAVVLLVKEAYNMEDMIRAGLTTKSGKELLSSGGMFYIQAKDSAHVKIAKPLFIDVPTDEVDSKMKLYKGGTTPLGKIDWQEPVALKKDTAKIVSRGEILFKENCKSCHTLGKESVGPDLAYIGKRRDFDWLKRYVRNSSLMIAQACGGTSEEVAYVEYDSISTNVVYKQKSGQDYAAATAEESGVDYSNDEYAVCLFNANSKAVMTAFPTLSEKEIKALANYCNDESKRLKLPYPKDELYINFQKCKTYKALMSKLYEQKYKLQNKRADKIVDNGPFVKVVNQSMQVLQMPSNAARISNDDRKSYVYSVTKQAEYYQVEVSAFGWHNIDMLTKNIPGVAASKLFVHVADSFAKQFQIYLILPDTKVYGAGGLLKDKKDVYGFYEDNGNINLPQGKTAHVYLVGEKNRQLLYAAATFVIDTLNNIRLEPIVISKEIFNKKIKELLQTESMSVQAKDSKNAAKIRKIDSDLDALEEKIKEAKKTAPKDCDCGCIWAM
ncbi:c-type cytochrome [Cytophaga aurantiaca]|uniref:c-type cytochrome n=1 Tax=Cytophaga aurantiaca TaxID=29530 RepID=UPI00036E8DBE|nr:cytochrome c [Cytophaga aurantiaca]